MFYMKAEESYLTIGVYRREDGPWSHVWKQKLIKSLMFLDVEKSYKIVWKDYCLN